jgi:choline-sulfatase
LLITLDTLRADYIHAYGFPAPITPNIDALAKRGALFETAIAASSRTVPSHASIMTSRFVRQHSVGTENGSTQLTGHETLAQRFKAAGYRTGAFVSNFVLKRRTGLDHGFDEYDDDLRGHEAARLGLSERIAEETVARALAWLAGSRADPALSAQSALPTFLWVHLQDPHGPYLPPHSHQGSLAPVDLAPDPRLQILADDSGRMGIPRYQVLPGLRTPSDYATRYAEEIAYADYWVGELLRGFRKHSSRDPVIVLTADHGESLGEAGYYFQHGQFTSPEQVYVPFIVVARDVEAARYPVPVSHVDLAPTLLDLAALPPFESASGVSLAPLLQRGESLAPRVIYSETKRELTAYRDGTRMRVRAGPPLPGSGTNENPIRLDADLRWRAFQREIAGGGSDPSDDGNDWEDLPLTNEDARALERDVRGFLRERMPTAPARQFTSDDIERLRALGYLPGN